MTCLLNKIIIFSTLGATIVPSFTIKDINSDKQISYSYEKKIEFKENALLDFEPAIRLSVGQTHVFYGMNYNLNVIYNKIYDQLSKTGLTVKESKPIIDVLKKEIPLLSEYEKIYSDDTAVQVSQKITINNESEEGCYMNACISNKCNLYIYNFKTNINDNEKNIKIKVLLPEKLYVVASDVKFFKSNLEYKDYVNQWSF